MLPDLSGLCRFKKICVVPTFIPRWKENLVSVFACAVLFSLPEWFVCAQARLRLVCVWMCVRGSNLETASINTVMWAAWRSHWRNLNCSQMNTSQKGGGVVADVIVRGQRNTQHPLISPALLALYWHARVKEKAHSRCIQTMLLCNNSPSTAYKIKLLGFIFIFSPELEYSISMIPQILRPLQGRSAVTFLSVHFHLVDQKKEISWTLKKRPEAYLETRISQKLGVIYLKKMICIKYIFSVHKVAMTSTF